MNRLPRWRIAAAILILGGLVSFLALFAPIYFRNMELQRYVSGLTRSVEISQKSDDLLRTWVLDKAHQLELPVAEDNVHILRSADGLHIDVRYFVRVICPGTPSICTSTPEPAADRARSPSWAHETINVGGKNSVQESKARHEGARRGNLRTRPDSFWGPWVAASLSD